MKGRLKDEKKAQKATIYHYHDNVFRTPQSHLQNKLFFETCLTMAT